MPSWPTFARHPRAGNYKPDAVLVTPGIASCGVLIPCRKSHDTLVSGVLPRRKHGTLTGKDVARIEAGLRRLYRENRFYQQLAACEELKEAAIFTYTREARHGGDSCRRLCSTLTLCDLNPCDAFVGRGRRTKARRIAEITPARPTKHSCI